MPITAKAVYVNYQEVILVFKLTVFEWILIFTRKWVELENLTYMFMKGWYCKAKIYCSRMSVTQATECFGLK